MTTFLYLPSIGGTNQYCDNMAQALSRFGPVSGFTVRQGIMQMMSGKKVHADVVVLNWMENEIVGKNGALSVIGFAKALCKVLLSRLFARKVLYVRHNRFPHCTAGKHAKAVTRATDFLERCCTLAYVHSVTETKPKRLYVPHPLYRIEAQDTHPDEARSDYFACFGRILRYKNFGPLVQAFPADRKLLIFGACDDPAYLEELKAMSPPNVTIRSGYVSEKDAQKILLDSEGVLICHAEEDIIVSGAFLYALSLGVKTYAIRTDFTAWAEREVGPERVKVFSDIPELVRSLPAAPHAPSSAESDSRVQRLFGNQAVHQALADVLARMGLAEEHPVADPVSVVSTKR